MFTKSVSLTFAATLAALITAMAAPTDAPTAAAVETLPPVEITTRIGRGADASIQGGESASKNFGTHFLWAKNGISVNFARKMYLRFDLASVTQPLASLQSATVRLTMAAPNGASPEDKEWGFHIWGLPDADAGESWDEKTIAWENAPLNDTTSGKAMKTEAVALGTFSIKGSGKAGDTLSISTPELTKWIQSDTNKLVTLIITRDETEKSTADNVAHVFEPKEQSKAPRPTLSLVFKK